MIIALFCCDALGPEMAQSGHHVAEFQCLLLGAKRTSEECAAMSASLIGRMRSSAFRLFTITVSRSLASTRFSSESAPGPSIMGSEDEVEQSLGRPLPDGRSKRTCELTSSIVPRGTSFHRLVELEFPPNPFDPERPHAAAASLVHLNSVPSVQIRCIMTAKRRASATIAFFIPLAWRSSSPRP